MKFDLVAPCSDCPFLRVGGIRLRPGRAREIAGYILDWHRAKTFACHKTTGKLTGKRVPAAKQSHCAGALIFSHKNGHPGQIHQLAERLGMYSREALVGHDRVFDTAEEMLAAQERP